MARMTFSFGCLVALMSAMVLPTASNKAVIPRGMKTSSVSVGTSERFSRSCTVVMTSSNRTRVIVASPSTFFWDSTNELNPPIASDLTSCMDPDLSRMNTSLATTSVGVVVVVVTVVTVVVVTVVVIWYLRICYGPESSLVPISSQSSDFTQSSSAISSS
ncbi:hypothetical protein RsoM2USA_270 [Ralstonia phage RsoM2USA]|nr:hypothetical protein RsoM2USA_270 [Ralstonia phage RsoM2USA]